MPRLITAEQRAEVMKLKKEGMSASAIADKLKLGKSTCERIIRTEGATSRHIPADSNTELALIQEKIDELRARAKEVRSRSKERGALIAFCQRRNFTRADLYAAAAQMPLLRISKKHRLKRAEK